MKVVSVRRSVVSLHNRSHHYRAPRRPYPLWQWVQLANAAMLLSSVLFPVTHASWSVLLMLVLALTVLVLGLLIVFHLDDRATPGWKDRRLVGWLFSFGGLTFTVLAILELALWQ
ncbi:MAG TPA: hypothetical protein VF898_12985 [Chloroflexota bacterium]